MADDQWLKDLVEKRTTETWERFQRPYYISFIATDSAKQGQDYREMIAPLKLRQWAMTTDIPGVKVLAHPSHKAKVGFVPADKDYAFEDGAADSTSVAPTAAPRPQASPHRRATLQFLQTISALPDNELDEIHIPLRTIVRLLHG
jgi:hypothetical protein